MKTALFGIFFSLVAALANGMPANTISNVTTGITYTNLTEAVAASTTNDVLHVAPGYFTQSTLYIPHNLTLCGSGASTTIVQAAESAGTSGTCVLSIGSSAIATVEDITLRNGYSTSRGAGIQNPGTLTLNRCVISNNRTSDGSLIGIFGGGIYNRGTLIMNDCLVTQNRAGDGGWYGGSGGGVYNTGYLEMHRCSVYNNTTGKVSSEGSESNSGGWGGGIYHYQGTLVMVYTSVVGNQTGDGGWRGGQGGPGAGISCDHNSDQIILRHCTIAGNTPGVGPHGYGYVGGIDIHYSYTNATASHTIIANNLIADFSGTIFSEGHNITTASSGFDGITSNCLYSTDPQLESFGYHGGYTPHYLLNPASPCIDVGGTAIPGELDQKWVATPLDGNDDGLALLDIGTSEFVHANSDSDDDGVPDLDEITADTNPTQTSSCLRVQSILPTPGGIELKWHGGTRAIQVVECSDSLDQGAIWHPIYTNQPPTAETNTFLDAATHGDAHRFYRLSVHRN